VPPLKWEAANTLPSPYPGRASG